LTGTESDAIVFDGQKPGTGDLKSSIGIGGEFAKLASDPKLTEAENAILVERVVRDGRPLSWECSHDSRTGFKL
jgi:hypothetical protein